MLKIGVFMVINYLRLSLSALFFCSIFQTNIAAMKLVHSLETHVYTDVQNNEIFGIETSPNFFEIIGSAQTWAIVQNVLTITCHTIDTVINSCPDIIASVIEEELLEAFKTLNKEPISLTFNWIERKKQFRSTQNSTDNVLSCKSSLSHQPKMYFSFLKTLAILCNVIAFNNLLTPEIPAKN